MPSTVVTPDLRHAFTAYSSFTTLSALGQKTTPPFWPSPSPFHGVIGSLPPSNKKPNVLTQHTG